MTTSTKPITDTRPRCQRCRRLLAETASRPWLIRCGKSNCKHLNSSPD